MNCPKCKEECDRDEVDVGVGMIYGPFGCPCGWSEWAEYDRSEGTSQAELENPDYYIDSRGRMIKKSVIAEKLDFFGLNGKQIIDEVF